jgi:hypothetical protein
MTGVAAVGAVVVGLRGLRRMMHAERVLLARHS